MNLPLRASTHLLFSYRSVFYLLRGHYIVSGCCEVSAWGTAPLVVMYRTSISIRVCDARLVRCLPPINQVVAATTCRRRLLMPGSSVNSPRGRRTDVRLSFFRSVTRPCRGRRLGARSTTPVAPAEVFVKKLLFNNNS